MHWVTYDAGFGERTGILLGDRVHGLRTGTSLLGIMRSGEHCLREAGQSARRAPDEVWDAGEVRLLSPIPRPPSIRDALGFLDHLRGCYRALGRSPELHPAWSKVPAFYFANAGAVVGPNEDVPVAPGSRMFDLELEVAIVIGRGGRDLRPDDAETHIAGYMLFNDWTARDHQLLDLALGIGMGKSKDSAITLGPALVTADEFYDRRRDGRLDLALSASVNGRQLTRGNFDQMDWSLGELVAFISRGVDLFPGDVIGSGTIPGGCLLEHVDTPVLADFTGWLRPDDTVVLSGDGLGETRQRVTAGAEIIPLRTGY